MTNFLNDFKLFFNSIFELVGSLFTWLTSNILGELIIFGVIMGIFIGIIYAIVHMGK